MSLPEKILLIGGGGHCRACIGAIEAEGRFQIAGILDSAPEMKGGTVFDYPIFGDDGMLSKLAEEIPFALVAVGQIKSPDARIDLYERLKAAGYQLPVIASPAAVVSPRAAIGEGSIAMPHVVVQPGASVGANCILNSKALIEHDCVVGSHCHIACGAVICGGVRIGDGVFIGANATVREGVTIPDRVVVAAGRTVLH